MKYFLLSAAFGIVPLVVCIGTARQSLATPYFPSQRNDAIAELLIDQPARIDEPQDVDSQDTVLWPGSRNGVRYPELLWNTIAQWAEPQDNIPLASSPANDQPGGDATPSSAPDRAAPPEADAEEDGFAIPELTHEDEEIIRILGQPREAPYVVAIPRPTDDLLDRVQESVESAFITDSRRGRYIQAGAFPRRSDAEALSCQLRREGFDARVVYFRVR